MLYAESVVSLREIHKYVRLFDLPVSIISEDFELHFDERGKRWWVGYYTDSQRYVLSESAIMRHIPDFDFDELFEYARYNTQEDGSVIQIYLIAHGKLISCGFIENNAKVLDVKLLDQCFRAIIQHDDSVHTDIHGEIGHIVLRIENDPHWYVRLDDGKWHEGSYQDMVELSRSTQGI